MKKLLTAIILLTAISFAKGEDKDIASLTKGSKINLFGQNITVTDISNPDLVGEAFSQRFTYEKWDNPKIKQLSDTYKLKEVIAGGKTEFDKMVILNNWVYKQFRKFGKPTKNTRNALEILEMIQKDATFFCVQYAATLMPAAYSVGWTARTIGLHNLLGNPGSTEHSTVEVWSNQYRKWIMLDATFDIYLEKDGIPLNANEIRDEWFKNKGEDLVYVKGVEKKRFKKSDLPIPCPGTGFTINTFYPDWFSFLMFISNSDFMDSGENTGNKCFMIFDERNKGTSWHTREVPKDLKDAYWTLGEAKMSVQPKEKGKLTVTFKTNSPNFDTFLVKLNDKEWKESKGEFAWSLKKGANKLSATTRNKLGVKGPENYIVINR